MSGPRSIVEKFRKSLRKRHETWEQMISGQEGEPKELAILNRKVQWVQGGDPAGARPEARGGGH